MADETFPAFTAGRSNIGALNATDEILIVRSGVTYVTTPDDLQTYLGGGGGGSSSLIAIARNTTGTLVNSATTTRIDFGTKDYDPSTTITVGASWKFEPPANAWYEIKITQAIINRNGFAWVAGGFARIDVYKNGSAVASIGYDAVESVANNAFFLNVSGSRTFNLVTTDDVDLRFANSTGNQRELESECSVEIYKVT